MFGLGNIVKLLCSQKQSFVWQLALRPTRAPGAMAAAR